LDGWLGELGRKNLLLLAASPAELGEFGEFGELGELGDLGDWKPKTEIFFPLFSSRQQQLKIYKNIKIK
jgi:hypothetical protein